MEILTIKDAASEADITPAAFYQAIEREEVKPVSVLGRIGVTRKELDRFIEIRANRSRRGPIAKCNGNKRKK